MNERTTWRRFLTYFQYFELLLIVVQGKRDRGNTRHVNFFQFRDQMVHGEQILIFTLTERGHNLPSQLLDEVDFGVIVG